jgi:hypothetical protein
VTGVNDRRIRRCDGSKDRIVFSRRCAEVGHDSGATLLQQRLKRFLLKKVASGTPADQDWTIC